MSGEEDMREQVEGLKRRLRGSRRGEAGCRRRERGDEERKGISEREESYYEGIGCWRASEQGDGLYNACGATMYEQR